MRWIFRILMVSSTASPALATAYGRKSLRVIVGRPNRPKWHQARLIVALGLLLGVLLSPAFGADYDLPVLRGSEAAVPTLPVGYPLFRNWSGFYFGGDVSFNSAVVDFSRATAPLIEFSLQDTVVQQQFTPSELQLLGKGADSAFGGGAFVGYNTQWQDAVLGIEANYTHTSLSATSTSTFVIARQFSPPAGNVDSVTLNNATARLSLTDYGEVRGRFGYVVGNFLPYGFFGVVVGAGSFSVSTEVDATCGTPPGGECTGFPLFPGAGQGSALLWGYTVGAGFDWALTPNFFLRAEFDFDQFVPISNISLEILSGRVGAGVKF
jgi:outer membrane immunogenic protein